MQAEERNKSLGAALGKEGSGGGGQGELHQSSWYLHNYSMC
jgi:hypothetical protein